jgi:hypothetical protein
LARKLISEVNEEAADSKSCKVVVADGETGLTAPLRQAFHELTRKQRKRGLWFELEDYANFRALAQEIFTHMAVRLGEYQSGYVHLEPDEILERKPDSNGLIKTENNFERKIDWSGLIKKLLVRWRVDPADWLIVFNARNGAGGCAGWVQKYWESGEYEAFHQLMQALRKARPFSSAVDGDAKRPGGFNIIYAPCNLRNSE